MLEKTFQEIHDIETDTRLRTVGIQNPERPVVLISSIAVSHRHNRVSRFPVVIQSIVCIGDAGIAIRLSRIRITDIDKVRQFNRYFYNMAVFIILSLAGILNGYLFVSNLTDSRKGETKSLRLELATHALSFVVVAISVIRFLSILICHMHPIGILRFDADVTNLLAYLYLVNQRNITTLKIAYQVVKRQECRIDIHGQRILYFLVFLHNCHTAVQRKTVCKDANRRML